MAVEHVFVCSGTPEISVIIPSFDGSREGNVHRLIQQLRGQTHKAIEIILSIGESPNGHARNVGVEIAQGRYFVFIDDDVELGHEKVLANLIEPFGRLSEVGMTGPSQLVPPDANRFQNWSAKQIPRSFSPVVDEITDSDMVSHMCLAIPKELFYQVGKESDWLLAGTDPDLRYRVRKAGFRIVVVPQTWAYHPAPESFRSLVRFAFKKGSYSAWQYQFARDLMYDCPDGHTGEFAAQTTLAYRVIRKGCRALKEIVAFRPLGLLYDMSYVSGYLHGLIWRWR